MNFETAENHSSADAAARAHVAELLPAYITRTLATADHERVAHHLTMCAACTADLVFWQAITTTAQATMAPAILVTVPPSPDTLAAVWDEIDAATAREQLIAPLTNVKQQARFAWSLLHAQIPLIPRGIWVVSLLIVAGCLTGLLLYGNHTGVDSQHMAAVLSFVAPLITALSLAYIYGPETDAGLEITLAAPTSPRVVLLARLGIVFGYHFILLFALTLGAVALWGGDVVLLTSAWIGPLLLLSGLSLALTVCISTLAGTGATVILWFAHLLSSGALFPEITVFATLDVLWQTTPPVIVLAGALLALAVLAASRRVPRCG